MVAVVVPNVDFVSVGQGEFHVVGEENALVPANDAFVEIDGGSRQVHAGPQSFGAVGRRQKTKDKRQKTKKEHEYMTPQSHTIP